MQRPVETVLVQASGGSRTPPRNQPAPIAWPPPTRLSSIRNHPHDAHLWIPMPELSRLSDAERRVLLLLARGHTAKTAAAELGVSEGSVNERLREARRKSDVGSSRQLPRMVADRTASALPRRPSMLERAHERRGAMRSDDAASAGGHTLAGQALMGPGSDRRADRQARLPGPLNRPMRAQAPNSRCPSPKPKPWPHARGPFPLA